ncbi:hypothetical protein [Nocardia sp. CA-135398]|uniref:hypothetical protein n=1 Tax=Nocardia sp. CA-135398 TaxID=3239977 RepID=UPI003D95EC7F
MRPSSPTTCPDWSGRRDPRSESIALQQKVTELSARQAEAQRAYAANLADAIAKNVAQKTENEDVPSAGHIEHGNGDELRFSGGRLVIEADYQL